MASTDRDQLPQEPSPLSAGATEVDTPLAGRIDLRGKSLREHAARGVLINSAFQVGLVGLSLVRNVAIAAFLTASEFGLWGLIVTTLLTLAWLKQVGIGDKYIQQDEPDQKLAFQKAFTLELAFSGLFFFFVVAVLPVYATIYGRPEIIVPGIILSLSLPLGALQTPLWIPYRQMRFVRQRVLEAIGPVFSTLAVFALAIGGAGYWSLVIGLLLGTAIGAVVAVVSCPYPLALRYDRGTLGEYFGFSWPLFTAGVSGLIVVQGTMIIGSRAIGLAGIGAIGLAYQIAKFGDHADAIISRTVYPAVCAVKDRIELLHETFVKSNRLALMWGMPFGIGLALFAPDLIEFALGDSWRQAAPLLQAFGIIFGFRQIGFNWALFYTARGQTRPIAVEGALLVLTFALVTAPLLIVLGLTGYIIGAAATVAVQLAVRSYFLARLFDGFSFLTHLLRAIAPTAVAVAVVLAIRIVLDAERTPGVAAGELGVYLAVTAIATAAFERRLLQEIYGYLRSTARGPGASQQAEPPSPIAQGT